MMTVRDIGWRVAAIAVVAAVCVLTPESRGSAAGNYTYKGEKFDSANGALAAHKRDVDAQVAAVTPVPSPLHGRALLVIPDRDRMRPLIRAGVFKSTNPTPEALDFAVDFTRQMLRGVSEALARGRLFDSIAVVVRNDTEQPSIESYDYLVWYQVKSIGANFAGPWTGQWLIQKRGAAIQLRPSLDPGLPERQQFVALVDSFRLNGEKLAATPGAPGSVAAAAPGVVGGAGKSGNLRRASIGSGVIVGNDGLVVTNAHVTKLCTETRIVARDGSGGVAAVKAQDAQNDLALLQAGHHWPVVAQFRGGAGIRQGDDVVVVGYPLNGLLAADVNITTGAISALAGLRNDTRFLQLTAPVQPGNSGGPALDMSGHLIGIVTSKLNAISVAGATGDIPQNVNFAIKETVVRDFLDANGVHYATAGTKQALHAADIGDIAKKFTVLVECWR
jgi:S1-C subfamily serine protease